MIKPVKSAFQNLSFLRLGRFMLAAFLLTFPLQIQSLVYAGTNFFSGNLNPYRVYALHLADIFLIAALICWGVAHFRGEVKEKITLGDRKIALLLLLFAAVFLYGVVFGAQDKVLGFYLMLQMMFAGIFFLMAVNKVMDTEGLIRFFVIGMALQAGLAVAQYSLQHSAGLIGEPHIAPYIAGVAKIDLEGVKLMRAYGTFPHANVLGGALFMAIMFSFYLLRNRHLLLVALTVVLAAGFLLSFSRSAVFALLTGFLLYVSLKDDRRAFKYVFLAASMMLFFIVSLNLEDVYFKRFMMMGESSAVTERIGYMAISKRMLADVPLGVGPGGFTFLMQDYSSEKIMPWAFQPVHNVFLLVANELGVQGAAVAVILFVYIFYAMVKAVSRKGIGADVRNRGQVLLAVLGGAVVICFFDHYFYTIYQGQVMAALMIALASVYLKSLELPRRKS